MDIIINLLLIIVGWLGSYFINFLCDILPLTVEETPHSLFSLPFCTQCSHERSIKEFGLFRPCRQCGKRVPVRYWFVLVASIAACFLAFYMPVKGLFWWLYLVVLYYFLVVAIIDIEHRIILRSLTLFGLLLCLLAGFLINGLPLTLLGSGSGLVVMLLIYLAGVGFSKWMERKRGEPMDEALGKGDIYISTLAGLLASFPGIFSTLLTAIVLGGLGSLVVVIYMVLKKEYKAFTPIPYAPFIIFATLLALYH
jgi:leader peptidase (prepilin peptidase) / N-methyltransferase